MISSRVVPLIVAIIAPMAMLSSCAAIRPAETPTTLRLAPAGTTATDAALMMRSIAVAAVHAQGFTGHLRYVYVADDHPAELREAATLFWEEAPPVVLQRALVAGLQTRFTPVSGPGVVASADWRVLPTLIRFEEVTGAHARAVVGFGAVTLHLGQPVRDGHYCGAAPIADASPSARALAFNAAIAIAVAAFVQDSAAIPASASPAPPAPDPSC